MIVRVRVPAPTPAQRRAALRDCLPSLAFAGATVAVLAAVLLAIKSGPGMFVADVHTRVPALVTAAVLALSAQGGAISVRYRDHLGRQRRQAAWRSFLS